MRELRDFIMIDKDTLGRLRGALWIVSSVIGEKQWMYSFYINAYKLDKNDLIGSYKKLFFDPLGNIDPETGEQYEDDICIKGENYSFSELIKVDDGLWWLEHRINKEIVGKCSNSEDIAHDFTDFLCLLNDWDDFYGLCHCHSSYKVWAGDLVFIPYKDEYLVLFLGKMTQEARSSEYWRERAAESSSWSSIWEECKALKIKI